MLTGHYKGVDRTAARATDPMRDADLDFSMQDIFWCSAEPTPRFAMPAAHNRQSAILNFVDHKMQGETPGRQARPIDASASCVVNLPGNSR
jgi:hypothetical protein